MPLSDSETLDLTRQGWDFVFRQGAMIALMPIEDWLTALDRAETVGPILDPTLYRDYLQSGKGEVIKDVLHAALAFKRVIVAAQEKVKSHPEWME